MADIFENSLYEDRSKRVRLTAYQTLGWPIFLAIVILIACIISVLCVWAALTYPSIDDVMRLADRSGNPATPDDLLKSWQDAGSAWVQQLVSISQLALFDSFLPLLGTITGYLLGEKAGSSSQESAETV